MSEFYDEYTDDEVEDDTSTVNLDSITTLLEKHQLDMENLISNLNTSMQTLSIINNEKETVTSNKTPENKPETNQQDNKPVTVNNSNP